MNERTARAERHAPRLLVDLGPEPVVSIIAADLAGEEAARPAAEAVAAALRRLPRAWRLPS